MGNVFPDKRLKQAGHFIPAVVRVPGKEFFAPSQSVIKLESIRNIEVTLSLTKICLPTTATDGIFLIKSAKISCSMFFNLFRDKRSQNAPLLMLTSSVLIMNLLIASKEQVLVSPIKQKIKPETNFKCGNVVRLSCSGMICWKVCLSRIRMLPFFTVNSFSFVKSFACTINLTAFKGVFCN